MFVKGDEVRFYAVAVLNVEDERYGLIQLPDQLGKDQQVISYYNIGNLGENLGFFCHGPDFRYYDIWILKDYPKTELRTRIKIMEPCMMNVEAFVYFHPLCLSKSGELLIRVDAKEFVVHDGKKKSCMIIVLPHMKASRMISFVESLVSPYAKTS